MFRSMDWMIDRARVPSPIPPDFLYQKPSGSIARRPSFTTVIQLLIVVAACCSRYIISSRTS